MSAYDFIVVGSGSAGSVLTNRLSELPDATTLVLEVGGDQIPEAVQVPYRWAENHMSPIDWAYMSVPQPALDSRPIYTPAGKLIGGSGNMYHQIHVRGHASDFDNWAYNGAAGWSFSDVLPYFQKLENQQDDTNPTAGKGGPLDLIGAKEKGNPVSKTFIEASMELGHPYSEDFNANLIGAGWHHLNIRNGERFSPRSAYLEPALKRPNVTLSVNSRVSRLMFEGNRCVGVEYVKDGQVHEARAERQVILSAGSIESAKLLQLSGIGNPEQLQKFDIPVVANLPGVGENFHDHALIVGPIAIMDEPGPSPRNNLSEVALFAKSNPGLPAPDLQIGFIHLAQFQEVEDPRKVLAVPGLVRPFSRGWVRLASTDPDENPLINANYMDDPQDLERMVLMVNMVREIFSTKAFGALGLKEIYPATEADSDESLRAWARQNVGSYYHYSGTAKMGVDQMAVVDPRLKVHGLEGLRIADGSVMSAVPSGNCHAAIVMIAERAADFIKQDLRS